jgi:hypothetical protein
LILNAAEDRHRGISGSGLPEQLHRELNQTRRPRGGDASEVPTIACIPVGLLKLGVIPGIKELGPKVQPDGFPQAYKLGDS